MPNQAESQDLLPVERAMPTVKQAGVTPLAKMTDVQPLDMQALFEKAMDMGPSGAEVLERLTKLKHDIDDRNAAMAFAQAKAQFQKDCPPLIRRHKNAGYTRVNRAGATVPSMYTSLEDMEAIVLPSLEKSGFTYDWGDMKEDVEKQELSMPFILTHIGGHQKKNWATLPTTPGEGAEKKKTTAQQSRFSVVTYLQRLSMRLGLGLGGGEYDDDGAGGQPKGEPITEDQAKKLGNFMMDVQQHTGRFFAYFSAGLSDPIKDLTEFPAARYEEAMGWLEKKREQQEKANG